MVKLAAVWPHFIQTGIMTRHQMKSLEGYLNFDFLYKHKLMISCNLIKWEINHQIGFTDYSQCWKLSCGWPLFINLSILFLKNKCLFLFSYCLQIERLDFI